MSPNTGEMKETIIRFIIDELGADEGEFDETTHLFEEEVIDSLSVPHLVVFLEEQFDITLGEEHFNDPRFINVQGIAAIVAEIQSGS